MTSAAQTVETFTIITTVPNPMVAGVHDRMPVILGPEHYQWWLEPNRFEPQFLKTLLRPYPAEDKASYRVSKLVNNARFDAPACASSPAKLVRHQINSLSGPSDERERVREK